MVLGQIIIIMDSNSMVQIEVFAAYNSAEDIIFTTNLISSGKLEMMRQ